MNRSSALVALRHRDFRLLWAGQAVSLLGTQVQTVALAWLVYSLTGSAAQLGGIGLARAIPTILLSLFGGTLADRRDRRKLLIILQTEQLVFSLALAAIVAASDNPSRVLIFGCVLSWVSYSLIGKIVMKDVQPVSAVTYACLVGAAALLPPALFEGMAANLTRYSPAAWLSIVYLGFFGTCLGFVWYYEGIKQIGPSKSAVFINFVPISAVVMAFFLLGETIDASLLIGAALVLSGIYLTNRPTKTA